MQKIQASLINFFTNLRTAPEFEIGEIAKHRIFGLVTILEIRLDGWVAIKYEGNKTAQVHLRTLRKNR